MTETSTMDRTVALAGELLPVYNIVVAGHGSRDLDGVSEFEQLIALMKERCPEHRIDHGYLEFAKPTVDDALRASIASGSKRIVMVPALLSAATHAKNDMPSELVSLRKSYPQIEIHFGSAMDLHPLLLQLCRERIVEVEAQAKKIIKRSDSCLVVVVAVHPILTPILRFPNSHACWKKEWVLAHPLSVTRVQPDRLSQMV